jgi:hypothetical protein
VTTRAKLSDPISTTGTLGSVGAADSGGEGSGDGLGGGLSIDAGAVDADADGDTDCAADGAAAV